MLALGNRSAKVASVNQLSIGDFGFLRGSVGFVHELGGGFPYFSHSGHLWACAQVASSAAKPENRKKRNKFDVSRGQ